MIVPRALRILGSASLLMLALGGLHLAAAPPPPPAAVEVKIDNYSYAPAALDVSAGTTVTFNE